jgi:hypothetical protein
MSHMTDALEELIGDHLFRTATWAKPANIYIGLITAVTDAEAGSVTEVSGGSYARVSVALADASWDPPAGGNKTFSNAADVVFPTPSANWGTATHFGVWDASSGGTLLIVAPLTASRVINSADPDPTFAAGDLQIVFSGECSDYLVDTIGDHLLRTATFAKPAALYFGLRVSGTEVTGGSYARVACNPLDANWNAPTAGDGLYTNVASVVFPVPTGNWGAVDSVSIFDASSSGNEWFRKTLAAPITINTGALAPNFAAESVAVTLA